jgi:hypothetical protein
MLRQAVLRAVRDQREPVAARERFDPPLGARRLGSEFEGERTVGPEPAQPHHRTLGVGGERGEQRLGPVRELLRAGELPREAHAVEELDLPDLPRAVAPHDDVERAARREHDGVPPPSGERHVEPARDRGVARRADQPADARAAHRARHLDLQRRVAARDGCAIGLPRDLERVRAAARRRAARGAVEVLATLLDDDVAQPLARRRVDDVELDPARLRRLVPVRGAGSECVGAAIRCRRRRREVPVLRARRARGGGRRLGGDRLVAADRGGRDRPTPRFLARVPCREEPPRDSTERRAPRDEECRRPRSLPQGRATSRESRVRSGSGAPEYRPARGGAIGRGGRYHSPLALPPPEIAAECRPDTSRSSSTPTCRSSAIRRTRRSWRSGGSTRRWRTPTCRCCASSKGSPPTASRSAAR